MNINWGSILKSLRENANMTQEELAERSGIGRGWLSRAELGHFKSPDYEYLKNLAEGLEIPLSQLVGKLFGEKPELPRRSLETILSEARERYEAMEIVELPVRGAIPAGYPFTEEETGGEHIEVPRELLGAARDRKDIYALIVSGNSLEGDGILSGDAVLIEPTGVIIDGKIYAVRLGNEVCARHVRKQNDCLRLTSSSGEHKDIKATEVEILGRVILSGRWKKH